ncbi:MULTISPECIES: AMP-dependent synthetase/ligase [unclassified Sulfitobacter]|uniref:AMP-dependent synthetase/ligase n=1 Tax=unclassified Sulfitobacter TaxID=196795 RepID=UPI0007C2E9F4|nr:MULTISPECIES: long-chain fatty acid--CoA ligase [unclassified Sulfitobacter]KZY06171.1 AMP-dependent synthetase [Sulfitobacter sp. HI0023]KZY23857.1 AMP-dependent synthetase [Sulfitobacter sp. HI0040]KZZ68351.1 AMP-dependent synthetase [Sulfitobacter sp. HI0129]
MAFDERPGGFRPLVQMVHDHAAEHGAAVAMRQKEFGIWHEINWADLRDIMEAVGAGLMALGLAPGGHVGILSENRSEWVQAQFGINAAAGVVVGMYPTSPAAELDHLINASDTTILFIEDQEQLDKIKDLDGKVPALTQLIVFDPKGCLGDETLGLISFERLLELGRAQLSELAGDLAARQAGITSDDTAMMVFTSGSTGLPKAAEISFGNIHAGGAIARATFGHFPAGTDVLSYLPLCHIAEQAVTVINGLSQQFVMNFGESLRTITLDLREVAPQIFFGVPRIWEKMQAGVLVQAQTAGPLRRPLTLAALRGAQRRGAIRRDRWTLRDRLAHSFWDALIYRHIRSYLGLGRTRFAITAAAPISADLLGFLRGIGINIREAWGMSETSGVGTIQSDWGACDGRIGFPVEGVETRLAEDGEVLFKGPTIFKGYYKNPKATAEAIQDGWLHTGDVGRIEPDGSLSLVDRKKDIMINAAGKNLSPAHIENVIKASPFIKEVIVVADKRPYVAALLQLDMDNVRLWAEGQGIAYTTFRSLAENPQVQSLIEGEVQKRNDDLARVEQVKKIWLLRKELDHDDGEVTATMKVRRAKIFEIYAEEIEALYR